MVFVRSFCAAYQNAHTYTYTRPQAPGRRIFVCEPPGEGGKPGPLAAALPATVRARNNTQFCAYVHPLNLDRTSTHPSLPGQRRAPFRAGPAVGGPPPRARPQRAPRRHHARAAPGEICTQTDRNDVVCLSSSRPCTFQAKTKDSGTIPSSDDETDGRKKRGRKVGLGCLDKWPSCTAIPMLTSLSLLLPHNRPRPRRPSPSAPRPRRPPR